MDRILQLSKKPWGIKWFDDPAKALGAHFTYDQIELLK